MDARCPEEDPGPEHYGLVLKGQTYQAVFSYTVDKRVEPATVSPLGTPDSQVFFRALPLRSLYSILVNALIVAFVSIGVWQGWFIDLSASGIAVFQEDEYWRLFTALFQHGDSKHLLNNLLPFVGLGWLLWGYFGYLAFPIVPLFAGTLANLMAVPTYPPQVHLVGISGTVFAMAGMWCALYVKNDDRFTVNKRILRAMGFVLVLFFPLSLEQNVADRVHILGGLLGLAFGSLGWGRLLPQRLSERKSSLGRVRLL